VLSAPGVSWRVGVVQPLDPNLDMNSLGEIGRSMIAASQEVSTGPTLHSGLRARPRSIAGARIMLATNYMAIVFAKGN
jgi:hypothetical protein